MTVYRLFLCVAHELRMVFTFLNGFKKNTKTKTPPKAEDSCDM